MTFRSLGQLVGAVSLLLLIGIYPSAQKRANPVYIPYDDARPILEALTDSLPAELKQQERRAASWPDWVTHRDAEIRARLLQGDEDSLVNFLLFGTSYTKQPRITSKQLLELAFPERSGATGGGTREFRTHPVLQARLDDLIRGIEAPRANERLLFVRQLVVRKGYSVSTVKGQKQIREYLLANTERALTQQVQYTKLVEQAHLLDDPTEEFAQRSKLYRDRGLSSDASLRPNFAIEQALKEMLARKLFANGSVRRVAIVGPGLDFTDKQEGYDFYPQQTIQPFAIMGTLWRLGLASRDLAVTTFDLSPRVNDHLERAIERARRANGYVIHLPLDTRVPWKTEYIHYWEHFADNIGVSTAAAAPAEVAELKVRAVHIPPAVVTHIAPANLNIILQRLDLAPSSRFDLIIATNILVYYDTFEQSLALANVERMLQPGGFLLSNNLLLELPSSKMHALDYLTVEYSGRPDDGDHIVWYRRSSD